MHRTPWTKQNSSVPSDRIRPPANPSNNASKSKGKGKQAPAEPPKSKDVRRLETLLRGVKSSTGKEKDPKGGCFCLARSHELSPYTPICHACGLILCSINLPQYCCPHCTNVLLTDSVRGPLITRLEVELAETVAKELEAQEKAIEHARQQAGAFPQLSAANTAFSTLPSPVPVPAPSSSAPPPSRSTHKVMSLTSGNNRRVVVSSYTTTPVSSRPVSRNEDKPVEEDVHRIPPPSLTPAFADRRPKPDRPWENMLHGAVTYKPPVRLDDDVSAKGHTRRKRNRAKGKENDTSSSNKT